MKIQNIHKNTIRHRKNNGWLQRSGKSEKPENDTKIKILKISRNCHKPSLSQGLEHFYKVTPCNEKCNFFILPSFILFSFILLKRITLIQYLFVGTGFTRPYFIHYLFVGTGSPSPYFQYIIHGKHKESSKYMIYGICSKILSISTVKIFHIHTTPIQWMRRIENDTKINPTFNFDKFL